MEVAILTPLALEYAAVRKHLNDLQLYAAGADQCELGTFQTQSGPINVLIAEIGKGNRTAALAAERIYRQASPSVMILTGIAGGVKDAGLGDIVVATKAYGYESAKITAEGAHSRPHVQAFDPDLIKVSRQLLQQSTSSGKDINPDAGRVFFGPIASGEKVIADTGSAEYLFLKQHYNDTLAIEMESIGFAEALAPYSEVRALNIRGISDLIDGKNARHDELYQPKAAGNAAAFVFAMLYQYEIPKKPTLMTPQELGRSLSDHLSDHLNTHQLPDRITLKDGAPPAIAEAWQLVAPLLEPYLPLIEDAGQLDTTLVQQIAIRSKGDEDLLQQLSHLLKELQADEAAETGQSAVHISDSKNVIQGSNIQVGGNFRLGDG